ncbi:MAG: hypothetical protein CR985_02455 [Flavobacteriales bacterium]|nr:MAG: hypothetical protein CR985_02455 [Flavobacteriales bacterium]
MGVGFQKLKLLYHTVKYLKAKQIFYRLYYTFRNKLFKPVYTRKCTGSNDIIWTDGILYPNSYLKNGTFSFLNIKHNFNGVIDWNYNQYGKLWTYNLNYFDFLNQADISKVEGLSLIHNYLEMDSGLIDGKEPYPISLRAINWIKFLSKNKINNQDINQTLYNHYQILLHNPEYHLLGNHLLENAFSLLFGAVYFGDKRLGSKAKTLLKSELEEQILEDGAHFELSPMYHQILLHRLLDCINLLKNNVTSEFNTLLLFLEEKAVVMVSWLEQVTFKNGMIPMVNDSAYSIAASTRELRNYAEKLGIIPKEMSLSKSGYRKFITSVYECFMDVGNVGPAYQPGHAHADTFSFVLHVNEKPIIIDPGVSTYGINKIRERERSTAYHNTVTVNGQNSSQVWGGFRVGKRAEVTLLTDEANHISARHNGFKNYNHNRSFICKDNELIIEDVLENNTIGVAYFHCHPNCKLSHDPQSNTILIDGIKLSFTGQQKITIKDYNFANGMNNLSVSRKIVVPFLGKLRTHVILK